MNTFNKFIIGILTLVSFESLWANQNSFLSCSVRNRYNMGYNIYLYNNYRNPQIQIVGEKILFLSWNRKNIDQGRTVNFVQEFNGSFQYSFQLDPINLTARYRDLTYKGLGYETTEARYFYNGYCQYNNIRNPKVIIDELLTSN